MLVSLLIIWSFIIRTIHLTHNTTYDFKKLIKNFSTEFQRKITYDKIFLENFWLG